MRFNWQSLKEGLSKTRSFFQNRFKHLFGKSTKIDAELLTQLEKLCLEADMGPSTTAEVIRALQEAQSSSAALQPDQIPSFVWNTLHDILYQRLKPYEGSFLPTHKPSVILMIGVNGHGKTTSLGKMAHFFKQSGQSVLLAAGDTFRAAAVEQLQAWGQKVQVPVIAQHTGADSASVLFDAAQAAQARGVDILLADTAGRLHTQGSLMEELRKIKRVLAKKDPSSPHAIWLVIDACIGQNALAQALEFHKSLGITGLVLTKMDGTAKGGIIFALSQALKLPIYFIGTGEGVEDLRPFSAKDFVDAFLDTSPTEGTLHDPVTDQRVDLDSPS